MSKSNPLPIRLIFMGLLFLLPGCSSKNDPKSAANAFFDSLQKGEITTAYDSTSLAFQTQIPFQEFETQLKELDVPAFKSIQWTSDRLQNNEEKLQGELIVKGDAKLIPTVTLIKESGLWRIYELRIRSTSGPRQGEHRFTQIGQSAAFNQVYQQTVPNDKQSQELIRTTLQKFNDAIQQKDFDDFYQSIATDWQSQISQTHMARAFQGFIDQKIDISAIKTTELKLNEPPFINREGCLVVRGYSKIPAYLVNFTLTYKYELPNWKLTGIVVNCED